MGKYKTLVKNIGILTIGQFSSKILVLLMVPLYTRVLSTEEYGTYDFVLTTVNLLIPILTLNISTSAQRFCLDKDADWERISKICFKYVVLGNVYSIILIELNDVLQFNSIISTYKYWLFLMFFVISINNLLVDLSIGQEKIREMAISGVISTFSTVILNIIFLLIIKLGITGYFVANTMGTGIQGIYLFFKIKSKKSSFNSNDNKNLEKEIKKYAVPQIANSISWWISNASDRYVIVYYCGIAVNGIYSVAYKIPAIINMVGNIIGQATNISIIKNYNASDTDGFFINTYRIYSFVICLLCSALILCVKIIAKFMFANDFYSAWQYSPMLLVASGVGALSGYIGGVFSAEKEAKKYSQSTLIGAGSNIVLNFLLVPFWGAMGAAIATMLSYIFIWVIRILMVRKMMNVNFCFLIDWCPYLLLISQAFLANMSSIGTKTNYILQVVILLGIIVLNKNTFLLVWRGRNKING